MVGGDLVAFDGAGRPTAVPGCPNATVGTAQIRSSSGSSGETMRTVMPGSVTGAGVSALSTISGCARAASPPPGAAAVIPGVASSIHSKDSGISSSRCRARTARMSSAVTVPAAPRRGRA